MAFQSLSAAHILKTVIFLFECAREFREIVCTILYNNIEDVARCSAIVRRLLRINGNFEGS